MDEITVDGFFEQYKDLLGRTISYGFPACCSIEELRKRMEREHIRVFVIDSSLGLCGFVLAKCSGARSLANRARSVSNITPA